MRTAGSFLQNISSYNAKHIDIMITFSCSELLVAYIFFYLLINNFNMYGVLAGYQNCVPTPEHSWCNRTYAFILKQNHFSERFVYVAIYLSKYHWIFTLIKIYKPHQLNKLLEYFSELFKCNARNHWKIRVIYTFNSYLPNVSCKYLGHWVNQKAGFVSKERLNGLN